MRNRPVLTVQDLMLPIIIERRGYMKKNKYTEIPCIMTRRECQEILNVSKTTVLKLIKENAITASLVAGKYLIRREDLIDFLEKSVYR